MNMDLPINSLNTSTPRLTADSSSSMQATFQQKMAARSAPISSLSDKKIDNIPLSLEEKLKIDNFINRLEQKNSDKELFTYVFNTLVHLGKNEKENFIAGASFALKNHHSEGTPSLAERFNNALKRYMSISLMNGPIAEQLNRNINQIKLEVDDDSDELDLI